MRGLRTLKCESEFWLPRKRCRAERFQATRAVYTLSRPPAESKTDTKADIGVPCAVLLDGAKLRPKDDLWTLKPRSASQRPETFRDATVAELAHSPGQIPYFEG